MYQGFRSLLSFSKNCLYKRKSLQSRLRLYSSQTQIPSHHIKTGASVGFCRLQDYYYDVIQENIMILKYEYPGDDYVCKPLEIPQKTRFCGPVYDESGKAIKKKGSNIRKLPIYYPVGPFNVPELESIQIQFVMKQAILNKYALLSGYLLLETITGERPTTIYSRSDVALWYLRKGMSIGASVTLTGGSMYSFLDKLNEVVLPRIKEWNGFKVNAGDGTGNFALGFTPNSVGLFPDVEVIYDMFPLITGFGIVFSTTSYRDPNARLLMSGLQSPFVNKNARE